MTNKILFIQPFIIEKFLLQNKHLDDILLWPIQLENFIKSKNHNIKTDLLYLPIEKKLGRISLDTYSDIIQFSNQMDKLIPKINFQIDKNTIIGISCTTSQHFLPLKLIVEYFKKQFKSSIIVVGGIHASARPGDFKYEKSPIDYIIVGEGELAFYDLIRNNGKKQDHPYIIKKPPIINLDDLPLTNFSLYDQYMHHFKRIGVSLSRGCPFNCVFCMEKKLREYNKHIRQWRAFSPKRAILEVENMIKIGMDYNIQEYGFTDSIFGFNRNWLNKFLELYPFEDTSNIWVESRIDLMNEQFIKKIYSKNFSLIYGLENFSERMLRIINKTQKPAQFIKRFEEIYQIHKQLEKPYVINIIFNHPGENKESFELTFNKLQQINADDRKNIVFFNIMTYYSYPGTVAHDRIEFFENKYGTVLYFPEWWKYEDLLKFGANMVKPSKVFSLREAIDSYISALIKLKNESIEKLKKFKPINYFKNSLLLKMEILNFISLKEEIEIFIENYAINS